MAYRKLSLVLAALALAALVILSGCATTPSAAPSGGSTTGTNQAAPAQNAPSGQAAGSLTPKEKLTDMVTTRKDAAPGAAAPKRGGTAITAINADWKNWDPTKTQAIMVSHMPYSSSKLIQGDWTKGPQGSGQADWQWGYLGDVSLLSGELAESWEIPDATTIIYHIRKDAKFQNKPPANGRPVTAQDVVWNIKMQYQDPKTWQAMAYPPSSGLAPTSVTALDDHTVQVKLPPNDGIQLLEIGGNMYTSPPEIWGEKATNDTDFKALADKPGITDWTKVVGSSAWIISDYVSGSQITLSRNPDYWEKDPLHPDQQLPYLDTLKLLILPDLSTRLTALRTGKIDWLPGLAYDDAKTLTSDVKDLQWSDRISTQNIASGRIDKPDLPFHDIRVRQAMNLAVDKQAILKDYMKGAGVLLGYPYPPGKSWEKYYTSLDQMPADVQELFTGYNPTKAKQLLAEAGYPNGFKTSIQGPVAAADEMSMLAGYLAKVGIDMQIQPLEQSQFNQLDNANDEPGMWYGSGKGIWAPNEMLMTKKGMYSNKAKIVDPYYDNVQQVVARDMVGNPDNYFKTMKSAGVYELQSAWAIWMPVPYIYNLWWPWLQNYDGINWTGWAGAWQWAKYLWVDQNMKKSMGY